MAINAADAWQQSGARPDRPSRSSRADRPMDRGLAAERRPERPARPRAIPPRERPADGSHGPERIRSAHFRDEAPQYSRPPVPRRAPEPSRPSARPDEHDYAAEGWSGPAAASRDSSKRTGRRPASVAETGGGRLRGVFAVLGMFVLTLGACGVDSLMGVGPGMLTLITLLASTAIAAFIVRRRDLLTVVVSPPLIFVAVVLIKIVATPGLQLAMKQVVPLLGLDLVRGFPTMAVGMGAAIVVGLIRLAARR